MNTRIPEKGLEQRVRASMVNLLLEVLAQNHEPNARYFHVIIVRGLSNLQQSGAYPACLSYPKPLHLTSDNANSTVRGS